MPNRTFLILFALSMGGRLSSAPPCTDAQVTPTHAVVIGTEARFQ
jgi:hypothetical protein